MGASRSWPPGPDEEIQRTQNATVFSQRNKADPNWALSEGLLASVDISRLVTGCFMVVLCFRKSRCFHINVVFGWE